MTSSAQKNPKEKKSVSKMSSKDQPKSAMEQKPLLSKQSSSTTATKVAKKKNKKLNAQDRKKLDKKIFQRALAAKKAALKSASRVKKAKVRTSVTFRRPHTLRVPRNPKYIRSIPAVVPKSDLFSIIKHPLTTEVCMTKLENGNTLTFIVSNLANKHTIKKAVKARYDVVATKVTTLNLPNGQKKAYVRLSSDVDAIEVANKIGIV